MCCMVLTLLPTTVFAEGGAKAIQPGTDGIHGYNTESGYSYIYYGTWRDSPIKWRVLDTKANTGAADALFLLTDECLYPLPGDLYACYIQFNPANKLNRHLWKDSTLQNWFQNTFYSGENSAFTSAERALIPATTQEGSMYTLSNLHMRLQICALEAEHVFAPSIQDIMNADYGFTDPASRIAGPINSSGRGTRYWLRSFEISEQLPFMVGEDASLMGDWGDNPSAVRPAMNLTTTGNNILFISAAEDGKPAGGLAEIPEYAGNEWKLTLLDSSRSGFAVTTTDLSAYTRGGTVKIGYTGAKTGTNEYVSAMILDAAGNPAYYGRSSAALTDENGTAELTISALAEGTYTLKVFNEQYNGDKMTDLASAFADVTLTVEEGVDEQFTLTPGGRYYFDLSAMNIPGTVNGDLPDSTLHYVPFTYTGTVYAYSLSSNSSGVASSSQAASTAASSSAQYGYARDHSLFIADYAVTHSVSWLDLNAASLIFGKDYDSGNISYALRVPSVGSHHKPGSDADEHGNPENNEWDAILNKARQDWQDNTTGYIKNWKDMYSTGQDTAEAPSTGTAQRMKRGYPSVRRLSHSNAGTPLPYDGFRPVLEVLNPGTLGPDGLKVVTLDLGGGKLGGSSEDIQIIVKNGSAFTAPASGGLTRPDGNTGSYFMWLDGNGNSYEPGSSVPADVTELTVQWTAPTYTVTLHANGGTIADGKDVTGYTYGVGATLPTDVTRTGYTFKGWYDNENLTGSPVTAISNTETGNKEYWAKWEINQYTITFDTAGGSTVASITQDYGTAITAPADPTREGYTFIGWDKAIPTTMPAENMTITAKWKVNQYTITFDSNGGSEIAPITQDYGTVIAAPANPTREGYTFIGWDKAIPSTMPAEKMIITAKWAVNQYTITFDTAGGSAVASITQDYGTAITAPADPTREGYTFIGWDKAIPTTMPAENMIITAKWRDIAVPTGEIKIAENGWKSFLNTITFGLFFKDAQMVTVTAADNSGEAVKIEYLLSDKALTESELAGMTFTAYSAPFSINPDNEYIIYVRLTDNAGNTDYICSDGIVLDGTSPVITGIENGKTYCAAQTVTVDEKYVDTVTVNGTAVTLDENGSFTLAPADGGQKIVVTDKAGNTAEMTVTVNDGHTYGEWVSNGDGTHTRQCTVDGCNGFEAKECSGGKATCAEKAVCEICGKAYGELDPKNHTDLKHIPAKAATEDAEGNIEHWYCSGCNNYYSDKDGTKEIKKTDTVTAKLPKSPPTGDTSNLMLWIALLLASGGVVTGVTVFDKRKRHSVK